MQDSTLDAGLLKPLREITDPKEVVRINDLKLEINEKIKYVLHGRYTLYALSALSVVYGIFLYYFGDSTDPDLEFVLLGGALMSVLYLGAALTTYRWMLIGLAGGLALYIFDHALLLLEDPSQLMRGLAIKAAIIFLLGRAVFSAFSLRKFLNQLSNFPVPEAEIRNAAKLEPIPRTKPIRRPVNNY